MGFRVLVSRHPAIQTTGLLTLAPAGLAPAEHASLHWTHNRTCGFPASGSPTGWALEQQTATSEVLQVVSSSPGELEPVFQTMLEKATRICEAEFGNLLLYEGNAFRRVALYNAPPAWAELTQRNPVIRTTAASPLGRLL